MNILFLDYNPGMVARFHCDRRLEKQILEVAQCLQAAHIAVDGMATSRARTQNLVQINRIISNSSSSRWVRETSCNYDWAFDLFYSLLGEYELRMRKPNSMCGVAQHLVRRPMLIPIENLTEFPTGMLQAEFRHGGTTVQSHRESYFATSQKVAEWTPPAAMPRWWIDMKKDPRRVA
jgi:hypothetical protein